MNLFSPERPALELGRRWPEGVPDRIWAPATAAVLIGVIGAIAKLTGSPILAASLAPTVILQTLRPHDRESRLYHVLGGHMIGLSVALITVFLCGATDDPMAGGLGIPTWGRVVATALALGVAMILQSLLSCEHPPAAATTLVVTLGIYGSTVREAAALFGGIVMIAALGEILRRLRLRQIPLPRRGVWRMGAEGPEGRA